MAIASFRSEVMKMLEAVDAKLEQLGNLKSSLETMLENLDGLSPEVANIIDHDGNNGANPVEVAAKLPASGERKGTQFDKIAEYLLARGNEPSTVRELAQRIEASRSAVSNVIYRTHKEFFTSHRVEGSSKLRAWSLRQDVYVRKSSGKRGIFD